MARDFQYCHCEQRSDEAIELDRTGALRVPRDNNRLNYTGDWYELASYQPNQRVGSFSRAWS